jgi:pimeloyl-ACP methyl ester carboxylesterase
LTMRFVLVHGGMHVAAHFDLLAAELHAAGHEVVAPDLPGRGDRASEKATWAGCRAAVADVIENGDVLVSHSAGGYAAALAAEVTASLLRRMVFVTASVPADGERMALARAVEEGHPMFVRGDGPHGPEVGISSFDWARDAFYHDCDEQLAHQAYKRLVPEQLGLVLEPLSLQKFHNLDVPRDYVVCLDDRSGTNARIETYLGHLGLRQAHLLWSSHSPFLSRPRDTAGLLVAIGGRA